MDIQERLTAFAMLGAEWVMWLLVVLSVVVLAIVLERAYYLIATRDDIDALKKSLLDRLRGGDVDGAMKRLKASKAFEARIALSGLEGAGDGAASAEEKMAGEARLAKLAMERNLAFVGTVGNNAPFVGLLGTVIGIIRAFHELESSGGQVSSGLMSEIGEALVAPGSAPGAGLDLHPRAGMLGVTVDPAELPDVPDRDRDHDGRVRSEGFAGAYAGPADGSATPLTLMARPRPE